MPGPRRQTLVALLLEFPELHDVMKAYADGFVHVPLTTVTTPKDGSGHDRSDCKVRGVFVVVERETHVARSGCVIKQDYLVEWLDGRVPRLTYYTGMNRRLRTIARSLRNVEVRHIREFCAEFGVNGQYGCGALPGHWFPRSAVREWTESYWRRAFGFALEWAAFRERERPGGPRRTTTCREPPRPAAVRMPP